MSVTHLASKRFAVIGFEVREIRYAANAVCRTGVTSVAVRRGHIAGTSSQIEAICGLPIQSLLKTIQNPREAIQKLMYPLQAKRRLSLASGAATMVVQTCKEKEAVMDHRQERLERQRLYQRRYRARRKRDKAPDRDDIARALLHFAITENLEHGRHRDLARLIEEISRRLEGQGFDPMATREAWRDLVVRYGGGWTFQRKIHLLFGGHPDEGTAKN